MATRYGNEGPGDLEILERVPGRVTVGWEVCLDDEDGGKKIVSTSFWFTDPSRCRHEWKLIYSPGFRGTHGTRRCTIFDNLAIEYCGESVKPFFVIKFRVTGTDDESNKPCEYYCDQKEEIKIHHDFSQQSIYDIDIAGVPIDKGDDFLIKIDCTIIDATHDGIEKK